MSMPSSSELVATIAFSVPRLSRSSISRRCSRASEPWWARASSSPASSFRCAASRSASRRAFTNTIVERWARISSRSRGGSPARSTLGAEPCPATRDRPSRACAGGSRRRSEAPPCPRPARRPRPPSACGVRRRRSSPAGDRRSVCPPRKRAISSSGRCVADRPIRWGGVVRDRLEPLEREREVRAALGAGERVDLVDDHPSDAAQDLARLRREHQVERLGRRDEDVGRARLDAAALVRRRVARCASRPGVRGRARRAARPRGRSRRAAPAGSSRCRRRARGAARRRGRGSGGRRPGAVRSSRRSIAQRNAASVLPEPVGARIRRVLPAGDRGPALALRRGGRLERRGRTTRGRPARSGRGSPPHRTAKPGHVPTTFRGSWRR